MRIVAGRFEPFGVPSVFLGGAVVCLLVDHPGLTEFRPTKDVDIVVEVATLGGLYALEERLRAAGFQHDTSGGAPICRWIVDGCRVDVMPVDSTPLGMSSTTATTTPGQEPFGSVNDSCYCQNFLIRWADAKAGLQTV